MIPQSTTLAERLEFYEWALSCYKHYICNKANIFYNVTNFDIDNLKVLFPELYKRRDKSLGRCTLLWLHDDYYKSSPRIEALQKAIIEVKRKIEEDGKSNNNL